MTTTRRRFGGLISGSLAAAGLFGALPALARGADDAPPNVFISPHGRPYRAPAGAPYPVVDWFRDADHDGDGKLGPDEFVADAAAFFDVLDLNEDGVLDAHEIALYEHRIAPEVLGMRVTVYASGGPIARPGEPRLWLAQYGPEESTEGKIHNGVGVQDQGDVLPNDVRPNAPTPNDPNAGLSGAALYGLIRAPEPVTAADPDYLFNGTVKRKRFLDHAHANFALLDAGRAGFLTLAGLPQSPVERMLGRPRRG